MIAGPRFISRAYVVYGPKLSPDEQTQAHQRIAAIFLSGLDAQRYAARMNRDIPPHHPAARYRVAKFTYCDVTLDDGVRIHLKDVDIP